MPTYCVPKIGTGTEDDPFRPDLPEGTAFSGQDCDCGDDCGFLVFTPNEVEGLTETDTCNCGDTKFAGGWVQGQFMAMEELPTSQEVDLIHRRSDVDARPQAQHHTLGNKSNQASPGTHDHNGVNSKDLAWVKRGTGNPNGIVVAEPGTLYLNKSGGAGATLWVKESGTGSSGWVAK